MSPAGIDTATSSSNEDFDRKTQKEHKKSLKEPLIQRDGVVKVPQKKTFVE